MTHIDLQSVCQFDILDAMKRHTTIRLDKKTDELLKKLATLYGSQTNAISIAIDRLAREELPEGKGEKVDNRERSQCV